MLLGRGFETVCEPFLLVLAIKLYSCGLESLSAFDFLGQIML